jgi:hypothetical protein
MKFDRKFIKFQNEQFSMKIHFNFKTCRIILCDSSLNFLSIITFATRMKLKKSPEHISHSQL